jgi:hypothetical protein
MKEPAVAGPVNYTCPMHAEVVSAKPGNCPKCKMKLVPKKSSLPRAQRGAGHKH